MQERYVILIFVTIKQRLSAMIRLYVIDDHLIIIQGLIAVCKMDAKDITVTNGSSSLSDALQKITPDNTDIILLDLYLPQSKPVNNIKKLREEFPDIPVIIYSNDSSLVWQVAMFRNGAKAYVNKASDNHVLFDGIRRVFKGDTIMPAVVSDILFAQNSDFPEVNLAPDFLEIIIELSEGNNIKKIADKLNQSEWTIFKRLQRIRACFHVKTNCELVTKALNEQLPW
jgi:two-component system invasion response regulator UvrY